jgi:uncharacterized protein (TIGR00369 family)
VSELDAPSRAAPSLTVLDWPYARFLGFRAEIDGTVLQALLPFSQHLIGNPILPALHGGVVAAFLELTALAQLSLHMPDGRAPRTIDTTIDYLRSARAQDTHARAEIIRLGRRVAHVRAVAWQSNEAAPVATMRGHFLLGGGSQG